MSNNLDEILSLTKEISFQDSEDIDITVTEYGEKLSETDDIEFTQFSGAGQVIAGDAITKSGNTLNVGVDDSSIEVNSDALRVKASGITNAMLAGSIANDKLAGSIANSKLSNSSITVTDGSNSTATSLGGTITFSGTNNEVEVSESSGTITIGLPDKE